MTNPRHRRARAAAGDPETRDDPAGTMPLVERLVLLVFLSLIPIRAVLSETHGFESPSLLRGLEDAPPTAGPATTLVIISTIAAGTLALACSRLWRGGPRYRRTGAELGALLLVAAAVISTVRAGQKHLALIGVLDFLGMIALMFSLRQLLTRRRYIRLALCVILATGALVVTKAIYQVAIEYPDTLEMFEQHYQEDMVQSAGPEGAGRVHDFVKRLQSQAATGYFQHPNVLGSFLILICATCLALAGSRIRRRPYWSVITPAMIAIVSAVIMVFSQSKGAMASLGVALVAWVIAHLLREPMKRHPRTALAAFWLIGLFGCVAIIGVMRQSPDALGRSMLFRQFYWDGAAAMLRDQGYAGVGANNFGRWFPRFKSVECPEVVQSPHSWIVRLATEWGVLGLAGFLLVLLGITNRMSRSPCEADPPDSSGGSIAGWGIAIIACVVGGWLIVLAGSELPYLFVTLIVAVPIWIMAFGLGGLESSRALLLLDDDLGPVLIGLCAGAVGFLVHTSIDLAMFHPGSATTFFAILAIALAIREGVPSDRPRKPRPVAAVAIGVFGAIVVTAFVAGIAGRAAGAGRLLETARTIRRDTTGGGIARAGSTYAAAAEAYPLDGTALKEHADELLRRPIATQPGEHVRSVMDLLAELERRDPRNASLNAFLATVYYQAFSQGRDLVDLDRALAAMREAVADFPTSPNARIRLASLLVERAAATDSEDARRVAAREYRNALDLDARSIYVSKPHRYSEARRESIRVAILKLSEGRLPGVDQAASSVDGSPPTTTAPLPADRHRSLDDE